MRDERFDGLARRLGAKMGRRQALAGTIVAALAGGAAAVVPPALEASARKKCKRMSQKKVRKFIKQAARRYKQPYKKMLCVAQCESALDNCAVNKKGKTYGLFQFLDSTWKTTRYRKKDMWHPKWNALAAASMWADGHQDHWDCCCPKWGCKCPGRTPSWCRR
jgi:hypothetical protein